MDADNNLYDVERRHDIAVAILQRPFVFKNGTVKPIRIQKDGVPGHTSSTRLTLAGWGLTGGTVSALVCNMFIVRLPRLKSALIN